VHVNPLTAESPRISPCFSKISKKYALQSFKVPLGAHVTPFEKHRYKKNNNCELNNTVVASSSFISLAGFSVFEAALFANIPMIPLGLVAALEIRLP